ncbi:MAG: cytochrome C [Deltaproteobacteria bacterium]|nr:cytochrome C [Deltaproteobacteria bacterium]
MFARWSLGVVCFLLAAGPALAEAPPVYDQNWEKVGKQIYFDKSLSQPPGQSCASCHDPAWGWTGPNSQINAAGAVVPGAVPRFAGNRKPPSAAYAGASPVQYVDQDGLVVGGVFWDGRATGSILGDPLAEQALGPPLNRLEMHNPNVQLVILKVLFSRYGRDFQKLYQSYWGESLVSHGFSLKGDVADKAYKVFGYAVAAFERSAEVNPYDSRFDQFWDAAGAAGLDVGQITMANYQTYQGLGLSDDEVRGLALFNDATKGNCAACHVLEAGPDGYPLFTDFTYDNLGVPKNPDNPFYTMPPSINPLGVDWLDLGLGGIVDDINLWGKQKVPTLRNVDKRPATAGNHHNGWGRQRRHKGSGEAAENVKAYAHNGYFKSLEEIVHFYNTRDVEPWPEPEVSINVNDQELGNLGLSDEEEALLVLFMQTLSDTSTVSAH